MSPARTTACSRWTLRAAVRTVTPIVLVVLALPGLAADSVDATDPDNVQAATTHWLTARTTLDLSYGVNLDATRRPSFTESRFVNELWVPNMNKSLNRVGAGDLATYPGRSLHEELYFETVTDQTYRSMHRATSRALKEYLLEETGITDLLSGMGEKVERSKFGRMSQKGLGIDFGISHLAPEVSFRPRLHEGVMKITVRATGSLGFQYRTSLLGGNSRLGAKIDPLDGRYSLNYLIDF